MHGASAVQFCANKKNW